MRLLVAGKESLARRCAGGNRTVSSLCRRRAQLGKPGDKVRLLARVAVVAAQQDAEAITELEWALPRLEPARPARSAPPVALTEALWRRNGHNDQARARVLAVAAREFEVAQKAALKDSDALRAIQAKEIDEVIARIDRWVSKHR